MSGDQKQNCRCSTSPGLPGGAGRQVGTRVLPALSRLRVVLRVGIPSPRLPETPGCNSALSLVPSAGTSEKTNSSLQSGSAVPEQIRGNGRGAVPVTHTAGNRQSNTRSGDRVNGSAIHSGVPMPNGGRKSAPTPSGFDRVAGSSMCVNTPGCRGGALALNLCCRCSVTPAEWPHGPFCATCRAELITEAR